MKNLLLATQTPFYILSSAFRILRSPALLALCLIPGLTGALAAISGMIAAFIYRSELTNLIGVNPESWYYGALSVVVFLLGILLSALLGFATASIAGGYFIETMVEKLLEQDGVLRSEEGATIIRVLISIGRAVLNETILVSGLLVCTVMAFGLSFLPFLSLLPIATAALIAGFSLYNLPLGILDIPITERFKIVTAQLLPCITLGACFSAILLIPFASIFLLPAFYGTVSRLLSQNKALIKYQDLSTASTL